MQLSKWESYFFLSPKQFGTRLNPNFVCLEALIGN